VARILILNVIFCKFVMTGDPHAHDMLTFLCRFHPVGGFSAVIAGFAVAMKELNPEQDNRLFGVLSVRNKVT